MVGLGGIVVARGSAESDDFVRVDDVNLAMDRPHMFADPDLKQTADGRWQLVWLRTDPDNLAELVNPLLAAEPHQLVRSMSREEQTFAPAEVVVEPTIPGVVDPTAVPTPDGGLVVYASQGLEDTFDLWKWTWSEGAPPATEPTRVEDAYGVTPDLAVDAAGGQRLVVMVPETEPLQLYRRSSDTQPWSRWMAQNLPIEVRNPSLAVAPDGHWWLYYNRVDEDCLADLRR
jgi:hypothetical protein